MSDPEVYAQCLDAQVYTCDLDLLREGCWLNDNVLSLFFADLCKKGAGEDLECVAFAPSLCSFLTHQLSADDEDFAEESYNCVRGLIPGLFGSGSASFACELYIPVNASYGDSRAEFMRVGSGWHWSFLHVRLSRGAEGSIELSHSHYDSSPMESNAAAVKVLLQTLRNVMEAALTFKNYSGGLVAVKEVPGNAAADGVKQADGWSCGWYACYFAKMLRNGSSFASCPPFNFAEMNALMKDVLEEHRVQRDL